MASGQTTSDKLAESWGIGKEYAPSTAPTSIAPPAVDRSPLDTDSASKPIAMDDIQRNFGLGITNRETTEDVMSEDVAGGSSPPVILSTDSGDSKRIGALTTLQFILVFVTCSVLILFCLCFVIVRLRWCFKRMKKSSPKDEDVEEAKQELLAEKSECSSTTVAMPTGDKMITTQHDTIETIHEEAEEKSPEPKPRVIDVTEDVSSPPSYVGNNKNSFKKESDKTRQGQQDAAFDALENRPLLGGMSPVPDLASETNVWSSGTVTVEINNAAKEAAQAPLKQPVEHEAPKAGEEHEEQPDLINMTQSGKHEDDNLTSVAGKLVEEVFDEVAAVQKSPEPIQLKDKNLSQIYDMHTHGFTQSFTTQGTNNDERLDPFDIQITIQEASFQATSDSEEDDQGKRLSMQSEEAIPEQDYVEEEEPEQVQHGSKHEEIDRVLSELQGKEEDVEEEEETEQITEINCQAPVDEMLGDNQETEPDASTTNLNQIEDDFQYDHEEIPESMDIMAETMKVISEVQEVMHQKDISHEPEESDEENQDDADIQKINSHKWLQMEDEGVHEQEDEEEPEEETANPPPVPPHLYPNEDYPEPDYDNEKDEEEDPGKEPEPEISDEDDVLPPPPFEQHHLMDMDSMSQARQNDALPASTFDPYADDGDAEVADIVINNPDYNPSCDYSDNQRICDLQAPTSPIHDNASFEQTKPTSAPCGLPTPPPDSPGLMMLQGQDANDIHPEGLQEWTSSPSKISIQSGGYESGSYECGFAPASGEALPQPLGSPHHNGVDGHEEDEFL